jgi:DNA-binding transcriptional LysR family regulator
MKDFDHLGLDGRSLRTFLTVLEEGSVSHAAARLGVSQSAVSHTLDKLRHALRDPLFVRAGRGIIATKRARSLREPIQSVLDKLKSLKDERSFEPTQERMTFAVAANDFPRQLLFPGLVREFEQKGIDAQFRFMPSNVPSARLLHEGRCQFIVSPFPPEGTDIFQLLLFRDRIACFFDPDIRHAPQNKQEFFCSDHLEVRFPDYTSALVAFGTADMSELKAPRVTVSNFSDLAAFLKGTKLITTQLSTMALGPLAGFGSGKLPFKTKALALYLVWHRRDHSDPAHAWLRQKIEEQATLAVQKPVQKR